MKKRIVAVTCVLMFCLGLIGCGTERADKTQQLIRGAAPGYNDGLIRVGMIQTGKESDWRDANTNDYLNTLQKKVLHNLNIACAARDERRCADFVNIALSERLNLEEDFFAQNLSVSGGYFCAVKAAERGNSEAERGNSDHNCSHSLYVIDIGVLNSDVYNLRHEHRQGKRHSLRKENQYH